MTKAFCVGQAKSGTSSVYGLLAARYRAAHEPEREQILKLILRESHGEIGDNALREYLVERDRRLNLDYDIAWANQFIIRHLLPTFPETKFIVLIRDGYTWLQSIVGHLISREIPPDVRAFLDWWFKPDRYPHTRHDDGLKELGVYSVAAFLSAWNEHVNICTRMIPPDRRLFLRTHELNRSHRRLAEFLQVPADSLDVDNGYRNRSTWSDRIESLLDRAYVNEMVGSICGENMSLHFPEVANIEDAYGLWEPSLPAG
jgi:hypothetical protein